MLPREHRVRDGRELNNIVRSGTRKGCRNFVVSTIVHPGGENGPARFGFIVSKKVGNAVARNLVKRRLREAAWQQISAGLSGADVVVRALPASAQAPYAALAKDLDQGMKRLRPTQPSAPTPVAETAE